MNEAEEVSRIIATADRMASRVGRVFVPCPEKIRIFMNAQANSKKRRAREIA